MSDAPGDVPGGGVGRKGRGIRVQSDLFCKGGCGFYGNSNWQGYCSKCWKDRLLAQSHAAESSSSSAHHLHDRRHQHHQPQHQPQHQQRQLFDHPSAAQRGHNPAYFARGSEERSTFPRRLRTRTAEEPVGKHTSPSKTATFSRFEEKRIQHHDKRTRTVKSFFKKSSPSLSKDFSSVPYLEDMLEGAGFGGGGGGGSGGAHGTSSASAATNPAGLPTASDAFVEFLKTLSKPVAVDVSRHINSFTQRMTGLCDSGATVDEMSDATKEFYQSLSDRLRNHPTFCDATPEQLEATMDFTEKTLMTRLYKSVFFALSAHHEDKDLEIQKRIRNLNWVGASHLDCCIDESRPDVRDLIDQAITYAIEIDSRRAPQDKLSCIVKCSKKIFEILRISRDRLGHMEAASADEFLPALIFVVLRANPPLLHSNISYIDKFCNPGRLLSGEAGYYFTNLCCAVEFIEKLDHDSLNLTKAEFDRFMSGEALPPSVAFGAGIDTLEAPWLCEGVRIMRGNLVALQQLTQREARLRQEAEALLADGRLFLERITEEVGVVVKQTPLSSQPHKRPAKLDDSGEVSQNLPPPLTPQVASASASPAPPDKVAGADDSGTCSDLLDNSAELEMGEEVSEESCNLEDDDDDGVDGGTGAKTPAPRPPETEVKKKEKEEEEEEVPTQIPTPTPTPKPTPARRPNVPEYTGFSRQGESIPSIPCDTGSVAAPGAPASGANGAGGGGRGGSGNGDRVVSVLSGFLRIADAF